MRQIKDQMSDAVMLAKASIHSPSTMGPGFRQGDGFAKSAIRRLAVFFLFSALCILSSELAALAATPSLTVGSASGLAGTSVTLPITFDPGTASVAGMQFNLTLPSGLSTGTVTAGVILDGSHANKSVSTSFNGNTWTFIVFGLNQNTIAGGTLLTAQVTIAPGTAAGTLSVPVSAVSYTDANGNTIPPGTSTGGTVTVTSTLPPPPVISSSLSASGTVWTAFSYWITATNSPASFNATGLPAGLTVDPTSGQISGTPTAAGTSNVTLSATNAGGTGTATLVLTMNNSLSAPVITSLTKFTGALNKAFSYQIAATNNPTGFNATGLPAGLSVNAPTGLISGVPTIQGAFAVALSAANSSGTGTATLSLSIKRNPKLQSVSLTSGASVSGSLPAGQAGMALASMASPSSIVLAGGAPAYIVNAQGSDFAAGDILYWNNSGISTTFMDPSQLAAVLPGSLLMGGSVTVQVVTADGLSSDPLSLEITLAPSDLGSVQVFPNPWRSDKHSGSNITFDHLPIGSTVKIFTLSGRLLKTLAPASNTALWDLTNDSGDHVASGIYLYVITDESGQKARGKLAVIR